MVQVRLPGVRPSASPGAAPPGSGRSLHCACMRCAAWQPPRLPSGLPRTRAPRTLLPPRSLTGLAQSAQTLILTLHLGKLMRSKHCASIREYTRANGGRKFSQVIEEGALSNSMPSHAWPFLPCASELASGCWRRSQPWQRHPAGMCPRQLPRARRRCRLQRMAAARWAPAVRCSWQPLGRGACRTPWPRLLGRLATPGPRIDGYRAVPVLQKVVGVN